MEDIRHSVELMHVLRHSFRPSAPFQAALESFIEPGSERPRFLFKTMSGLAIEASERFRPTTAGGIFEARKNFERSNVNLRVSSAVAAAHLGNGTLRIFFGLHSDAEDNSDARLHTEEERLRTHVPEGEWLTDLPAGEYQLFTSIDAAHALQGRDKIHEVGMELKKKIKALEKTNTYLVTSELIIGSDELRKVQRPYFEADKAS